MSRLLRSARPDDAAAIAEVLIASRQAFLPYAPSAHPPDEVRRWVADQLIPGGGVQLIESAGQVVAVLAVSDEHGCGWIDQLYVLPGHEAAGLGTQLLQYAHATLGRPVRLHCFQENAAARRFYERHGYRAIQFTDGSSNEERCPDVLYEFSDDRAGA